MNNSDLILILFGLLFGQLLGLLLAVIVTNRRYK